MCDHPNELFIVTITIITYYCYYYVVMFESVDD